jgi:hypothetical protein
MDAPTSSPAAGGDEIERLARELACASYETPTNDPDDYPWCSMDDDERDGWRGVARFVLARERRKVLEAGIDALGYGACIHTLDDEPCAKCDHLVTLAAELAALEER